MDKYNDLLTKIEGMTVLELGELVKAMEEKFGVSANVVAASSSAEASADKEEKTSWNVMLTSVGVQKIQVIKAVKEITGLGLQEAKAIVDGAPKAIKEGIKKEEAEEMKKKLEAAGAVIELK